MEDRDDELEEAKGNAALAVGVERRCSRSDPSAAEGEFGSEI